MLYTIKVFYVSNNTLMLPNDKEKSVTISNNSSDAHTTGARSVTRRNLTRGALWAVPAIAASTAVPAFAASADDCKTVKGPDFTQVAHGVCSLLFSRDGPPRDRLPGGPRPRGRPQPELR